MTASEMVAILTERIRTDGDGDVAILVGEEYCTDFSIMCDTTASTHYTIEDNW